MGVHSGSTANITFNKKPKGPEYKLKTFGKSGEGDALLLHGEKKVRIDKLREYVQCKSKVDLFTTVLCKGYVIS